MNTRIIKSLLLLVFFVVQGTAEAREIRVLTLNAWFLPGITGVLEISKDDALRLERMPDLLSATGADLIALQEVWTGAARKALKDAMFERGYTFVAESEAVDWNQWLCLQGLLVGNGLMVFSRHEIGPVTHQRIFSDYTRLDEYFTIKGAIHFEVKLPEIGWVDFYNTHLGAVSFDAGTSDFNQEQLAVLAMQAEEFVDFFREHRTHSTQIIAGDMNQHPFKWDAYQKKHTSDKGTVYEILTQKGEFLDTFWNTRNSSDALYTFNKNKNAYVFNGAFAESPDEYIDYIFVNDAAHCLKTLASHIVFEGPILQTENGRKVHLSDHSGVLTTFSTLANCAVCRLY